MPGKIFVNYRRDDERSMAARIRDRLAASFGDANVFMDVDNLLAGQRFDRELEKALGQTDVFLAVIGPRWLELLAERQASGERDYVREEIAGALQRGIVVIPVLIDRTALPRADALPGDIRDLVLHQKHAITHERFGRDVEDLVEAIRFVRKAARAEAGGGGAAIRWVGAAALAALVLGGGVLTYQMVASDRGAAVKRQHDQAAKAKLDAERARQDEIKRATDAAAAKQKADEAAQAKRAAEEAERQRLAMLKAKQDRAAEETRKKQTEADLLRPGRVFRDCPDVCPEMVVLPDGEFTMGSNHYNSESPPHRVTIRPPFAMGKFEVTFAEWDACAAEGGCKHWPGDQRWGRGRRPVINVSWHDAKGYTAWLSRKTGKTYRLLSEAEWEYAARAGTSSRYAFGDAISKSQAQYAARETVEVGSLPANKFGLHDLHGNVWEWVEDAWHPNYEGAPNDGSVWAGGDTSQRVLRGGSWYSSPVDLRSAGRVGYRPDNRDYGFGFRVARTL
jgi:formylglycine-generating enzyme required for sulfatase activity